MNGCHLDGLIRLQRDFTLYFNRHLLPLTLSALGGIAFRREG